jgi:hypothetical protein
MENNYFLRILCQAPFIILGGIIGFLTPFALGQILFMVGQAVFGHDTLGSIPYFGLYILFSLGFGSISGIGLIFLGLDIWAVYRTVVQEKSKHDSFYIIAANQIALSLCAILAYGGFYDSLPGALLAFATLGVMFGITKPIAVWWDRRRLREQEAEAEAMRASAEAVFGARRPR